jgi:hypothetical protein
VLPRVEFLGFKVIFGILFELEEEPRIETRDSAPSPLLERDPAGLSKSAKLGIKGLRLVSLLPEAALEASELELGLEFDNSSSSEEDVSPARESVMGMKRSFVGCKKKSRSACNCMDHEVVAATIACETGSGGLEVIAGRSILEGGVSNEASSVV